MPNPIAPRKIVKPADPGQVSGYGRLILKDKVDPDYAEAAPLAYARPGHPIIVHEFDIPQHPPGASNPKTVEETELARKELDKYVQAELRYALRLMNEADAAKELPTPDGFTLFTAPPGLQRFQVSLSTSTEENVVRTYVVFHPNGRQVRTRRRSEDPTTFEARNAAGEVIATTAEEQPTLPRGDYVPPAEDEEPF